MKNLEKFRTPYFKNLEKFPICKLLNIPGFILSKFQALVSFRMSEDTRGQTFESRDSSYKSDNGITRDRTLEDTKFESTNSWENLEEEIGNGTVGRAFFSLIRDEAISPVRDEITILSSGDGRTTIVRLIAPRCPVQVKSSTKQRCTRVSGASWAHTMPGINRTWHKYNTKDGVSFSSSQCTATVLYLRPTNAGRSREDRGGGIDQDPIAPIDLCVERYCLRDRCRARSQCLPFTMPKISIDVSPRRRNPRRYKFLPLEIVVEKFTEYRTLSVCLTRWGPSFLQFLHYIAINVEGLLFQSIHDIKRVSTTLSRLQRGVEL